MDRIEQLTNLLGEDPDNSFILYALAKAYENQDQLKEAALQYEFLLLKDPDYLATYYHFGKLCEKLEDFDRAKTQYQMGIVKAQKFNDLHSLSELKSALMELELSL